MALGKLYGTSCHDRRFDRITHIRNSELKDETDQEEKEMEEEEEDDMWDSNSDSNSSSDSEVCLPEIESDGDDLIAREQEMYRTSSNLHGWWQMQIFNYQKEVIHKKKSSAQNS